VRVALRAAVVAIPVFLGACAVPDGGLFRAARFRDLHIYQGYAEKLLDGSLPYRDVFTGYAKTYGLDEAWVLGLVRQESRFVTEARSSAGAAGLMQVMPHTARFVAAKIGMRGYRPKNVTEVKTNIAMGTGYMKIVLEQLGHPVLASAAYNAGPNRARRWRDARPLEGAIYAETIPYAETREYVKRVMANSVFYAALLNEKPTPIKARLGVIPARNGAEPAGDEDDRE